MGYPAVNLVDDKVVLAAIVIQNQQNAKNSQVIAAVEAGTFVDIVTRADAERFVREWILNQTRNKLMKLFESCSSAVI